MNETKKNITIFYVGLHPDTIPFLNKNPFTVVASAQFDYFYRFSINPFNLLFSITYFFHQKKTLPYLTNTLTKFLKTFEKKLSPTYRRYVSYLSTLVTNNIELVDTDNEESFKKHLTEKKIDLIVINYWSILPTNILTIPRFGAINIHPSKLPSYRGALPTLWTLKNKDTESAVTYLLIDSKVDGGAFINQHPLTISQEETALSLEAKIDSILGQTLYTDLLNYTEGRKKPTQQTGEVTTTEKYYSYMKINWQNELPKDIVDKVSLYPFGEPFTYCFTKKNKKEIDIKNIKINNNLSIKKLRPGECLRIGKYVYIGTQYESLQATLFTDIPLIPSIKILLGMIKNFD